MWCTASVFYRALVIIMHLWADEIGAYSVVSEVLMRHKFHKSLDSGLLAFLRMASSLV